MHKDQTLFKGHLSAFLTILLWGTTFISTKVLLQDFRPVEILLIRFLIGLVALFIASPKLFKFTSWKHEGLFAAAGLLGICLYYLFENIALTYTLTANVGVIVSTAPFFTAILSFVLYRHRLSKHFFAGFMLAMIGIALISFQKSGLEVNFWGDFLALSAAFIWAGYSLIVNKISTWGYSIIQSTRRIFTYGILFIVPVFIFSKGTIDFDMVLKSVNLFNFLFLGLGASAMCFVTWNFSVKTLGAVRTSVYIYLVPIVTVATSIAILHEKITWSIALGILLTLLGLVLSERPDEVHK